MSRYQWTTVGMGLKSGYHKNDIVLPGVLSKEQCLLVVYSSFCSCTQHRNDYTPYYDGLYFQDGVYLLWKKTLPVHIQSRLAPQDQVPAQDSGGNKHTIVRLPQIQPHTRPPSSLNPLLTDLPIPSSPRRSTISTAILTVLKQWYSQASFCFEDLTFEWTRHFTSNPLLTQDAKGNCRSFWRKLAGKEGWGTSSDQ